MTQLAIHVKTGIAISYISQLEKAEVNPSLDIMAALARAVDANLAYFFADNLDEKA